MVVVIVVVVVVVVISTPFESILHFNYILQIYNIYIQEKRL